MSSETYKVEIKESSKELTAKERIKFKDVTGCIKIDSATQELDANEKLIIDVDGYVVLSVHNEKCNNPDYENLIIIAKDGTTYCTGSDSFANTFFDIWVEMDGEDFSIDVYRRPSKNYADKDFLTCSIVID